MSVSSLPSMLILPPLRHTLMPVAARLGNCLQTPYMTSMAEAYFPVTPWHSGRRNEFPIKENERRIPVLGALRSFLFLLFSFSIYSAYLHFSCPALPLPSAPHIHPEKLSLMSLPRYLPPCNTASALTVPPWKISLCRQRL